jgi:hypothetical protein
MNKNHLHAMLILTLCPLYARLSHAQKAPAPVPAPLTAAHKVFLGNAGEDDNATSERAYNAMYASLKKVNGYEMAASPEDADLVLELHCITERVVANGTSVPSHKVRMVIIDPKTRRTLWSLSENGPGIPFTLSENWGKNFDKVAAKLSKDLKMLASGSQLTN